MESHSPLMSSWAGLLLARTFSGATFNFAPRRTRMVPETSVAEAVSIGVICIVIVLVFDWTQTVPKPRDAHARDNLRPFQISTAGTT
jgi:hypothetical protein